VQNVINADGSGGGVYVITGSMKLDGKGGAAGTSSFTVLDADGKVQFAGTATFTATKLVVP
jgi:hypothetical protein